MGVRKSREANGNMALEYLNNGYLNFDELWIPKSFAPDYILQADAGSGPDRPKYTEPGHWVLSAESHWGTVTLQVFEDVSFRMVERSSR